ncbi:MAG: GspH/FimT family pseudopilin [Gammaproteobacteria bacterium]|nr:GspH/FimT family pseudopilin [Gammaproteobacteria bacterium]
MKHPPHQHPPRGHQTAAQGQPPGTAVRWRCRGASLLELLVALAIAGLLMGTALPAFIELGADHRAAARINAMLGAVRATRHLAITHNAPATLCAGQGPACLGTNRWHEGAIVFLDQDRDLQVDEGELVGLRLPPLAEGERIRWRAFRSRSHLLIHGSGLTDWQNGNFQYCPADGDARFARQIILNAQGRARQAMDADGDGIREDAAGQPLEC